ncbi:hypothetical protein [Microbispora hainanensis]|uniref:Uncharacterized protein n=1 Tax=Microbispora hainanensis TaxID=568844 RepID=A0A544YSD7_9ACTN|nr:hypothetical protein [Microbispora hainanensis]TQS19666.1 hypothetical protein FLX08_19225 [Microbispora hainanensis]
MSVVRMTMAAVCVAVVTGCSASAAANTPDLTLPLDAYSLGAKDRAQVTRARFMLMEECLRHVGIDFRFPAVQPVTDLRNVDLLGWLDPRQAAESGYLQAGRSSVEMTGVPSYSVGDEEFGVLEGKVRRYRGRTVPPGGCRAKADALLNRGARGVSPADAGKRFDDDEVPRFVDAAADVAVKDPRIAAAEREWSDCMRSEGFDYRSTVEAGGDRRWAATVNDDSPGHTPKPRGTKAEIDTAVADVRCRAETGYTDARREVFVEAENRVIGRNRARLDVIRSLNEARLANSAKVFDGTLTLSW